MQCSNNLKQFGLALHNHHDSKGNFPAAREAFNNLKGHGIDTLTLPPAEFQGVVNAAVLLLPYMEQSALYESFDAWSKNVPSGTNPWDKTTYGTPAVSNPALTAKIAPFYCPSDNNVQGTTAEVNNITRISYMFSHGDGAWHNGRCDVGESTGVSKVNKRGIFGNGLRQGIAACTDGTSNTIAISENCSEDYKSPLVLGGVAGLAAIHSGVAKPDVCMNTARSTTDTTRLINGTDVWRTLIWTDGRVGSSGFTTILPPNAPCCNYSSHSNGWGMYSPSSHHTGGVNGVFVDGSVHFISETIDYGTLNSPEPPSVAYPGKSPYGTWGALGSPNGGESKSL